MVNKIIPAKVDVIMENDLADRLDDLICAFDSGFDSATSNLESVGIVFVGWIAVGLVVFTLIKALFKFNQAHQPEQKVALTSSVSNGKEVSKGVDANPVDSKSADTTDGCNGHVAVSLKVPVITERPSSAPNTSLMNGSARPHVYENGTKPEGNENGKVARNGLKEYISV